MTFTHWISLTLALLGVLWAASGRRRGHYIRLAQGGFLIWLATFLLLASGGGSSCWDLLRISVLLLALASAAQAIVTQSYSRVLGCGATIALALLV